MKLHRTFAALGLTAVLVAPIAAFAQQTPPPWWNGNNGSWQQHRHDRDDRDRDDRDRDRDRDHHDRGYGNGGYNNGYGRGGYNNGYGRGGYNNGYNNGYGRGAGQLGGTVSSFSPFNLYLQNGTHVELHQGTVINPTGATPQPGQRVQVVGHWNSDGTFAADTVNLNGNGRFGYGYNRY
jgi:hypothetical protein